MSPIKELNAAIASHNPFKKQAIVTDREIWGQGLADLSTLNGHASDSVFQAIEQARNGQCLLSSMAIAGETGTGKSHLISRIRHHVLETGGAFFVYANVGQYTDLSQVRYQFQLTLVDSLRHTGRSGAMQWQELAAAIANQALRSIHIDARNFSPQELARKLHSNNLTTNQNWISQLTEAFFRIKPDVWDPDLVRGIVWTLSNAQAPFALKWLAGNELTPSKADELGLPNRSREYREADAFETFLQILSLLSDYNALIICFDQLDSGDTGDTGLKRERVVASLVKRLFDSIQPARLNRGVVVISVMTPDTWTNKVQTLPSGIVPYISGKGEPIKLRDITNDEIEELVTIWLRDFYDRQNLTPPTPVYPFEAGQLRALGREKVNVRQVLEWCAENFQPVEIDPFEQVERAFEEAIAAEVNLDDNSLIADALYFSLQTLCGVAIAGVTIEAVTNDIQANRANRGYIHFRVIGQENGREVKIGVDVLQSDRSQTVAASLKRLVEYQTFDITRGCLVRSQDKAIPRHWQGYNYLNQLISEQGGKWVDLKAGEIKPLVALWLVYQGRLKYGLSFEQIFEFTRSRKIVAENLLIRAILSVPAADEVLDVQVLSADAIAAVAIAPPPAPVAAPNLATLDVPSQQEN